MSSKQVTPKPVVHTTSTVNVQATAPAKRHWVRHALLVIGVTLIALAIWLAYTSLTHKVL